MPLLLDQKWRKNQENPRPTHKPPQFTGFSASAHHQILIILANFLYFFSRIKHLLEIEPELDVTCAD